MHPAELASRWRAEAHAYDRDGVAAHASLLRRVASELDAAWRAYAAEELSVAQAAAESGYSSDHLRELVRSGKLSGERAPGARTRIRIRRCDLPRKPTQAAAPSAAEDLMRALGPRER